METIWHIGVSNVSPMKKGSERGDTVANNANNASYQKYQKDGLPLACVQRERSYVGVMENTEAAIDKIKSSKINTSILPTKYKLFSYTQSDRTISVSTLILVGLFVQTKHYLAVSPSRTK